MQILFLGNTVKCCKSIRLIYYLYQMILNTLYFLARLITLPIKFVVILELLDYLLYL